MVWRLSRERRVWRDFSDLVVDLADIGDSAGSAMLSVNIARVVATALPRNKPSGVGVAPRLRGLKH